MQKVRLGIIGCGSISRAHMEGYKLLPDLERAACCDIDLQRAQRFQQEYGFARAYASVNEMMESAYRVTRIEMSSPERKQFFDKYIKGLYVDVDGEGNLTIQLKNR